MEPQMNTDEHRCREPGQAERKRGALVSIASDRSHSYLCSSVFICGSKRSSLSAFICVHRRFQLWLTILCLGGLLAAVPAAAASGVGHLLTEYLQDPLGIDVRAPRFSWQMTATERAVLQGSYQVQVATAAALLAGDAARPDVWDSGRVASALSVNVPYG